MSFQFRIIENPDYLHLKFEGTWTLHIGKEVLADMAEKFFKSPHSSMLLDFSDQETFNPSLIYDYEEANIAADLFSGKKHKIATLITEDQIEGSKFFQTVASNRGISSQSFSDMDEAIRWLNEGKK